MRSIISPASSWFQWRKGMASSTADCSFSEIGCFDSTLPSNAKMCDHVDYAVRSTLVDHENYYFKPVAGLLPLVC